MDGFKKFAMVVLMLALSLTVLGCQAGKQAEMNDRLNRQNRELQSALDRERAARDAAENERMALASEKSRLEAERERARQEALARQSQPATPVGSGMAAANTGFAGIEGVETEMRGQDIEVRVASDVLFAPGRDTLNDASKKTLAQVANVLKRQYANNNIVVEGHTDADPIRKSKWASNQQLSEARAAAVQTYLAQQGVNAGRIRIVGYGESRPRQTKALSRRVEIVVQQ